MKEEAEMNDGPEILIGRDGIGAAMMQMNRAPIDDPKITIGK